MEPTAARELSFEQGYRVVKSLVDAGLNPGIADRIIASRENAMARKMVQVTCVGYPSINEQRAREKMGKNYFGREEWDQYYGVTLTSRQSRVAAKFPWNEEVLDSPCPFVKDKAIRETHFAFLGLNKYNGAVAEAHGPLTIMNWQAIHPVSGQPRFYLYGSDCWYLKEQFAAAQIELRWYLGLKEIVPGSANTSWADMQGMIPDEYEVPSPVVETTKDFLCYQRHEVYPNRSVYAATNDLDSDGSRVMVGCCDDGSVYVGDWRGGASGDVGLSLFRKST